MNIEKIAEKKSTSASDAFSEMHRWHLQNEDAMTKEQKAAAKKILENASHDLLLHLAAELLIEIIIRKRPESEAASEWGYGQANKERARSGGKANAKKLENPKFDIKKLWSEGNFTSRDICAEQNYESLGFKSYKAARNALIKTPNPDPWPASKR